MSVVQARAVTPPAPGTRAEPPTAPSAEAHEVARVRASHPDAALVRLADEIFARLSPYRGVGLRNHCWRLYELSHLLLRRGGHELDDGVLYLLAMVHDLGLVSSRDRGPTYLARSVALLWRETAQLTHGPLSAASRRVLQECLLYNHRLRAPRGLSPQAEAFRRAVQIEHTLGRLRHGLPRPAVTAVFRRHPRADFGRVLVDFARRVLTREPATVIRGIFFAGGGDDDAERRDAR